MKRKTCPFSAVIIRANLTQMIRVRSYLQVGSINKIRPVLFASIKYLILCSWIVDMEVNILGLKINCKLTLL